MDVIKGKIVVYDLFYSLPHPSNQVLINVYIRFPILEDSNGPTLWINIQKSFDVYQGI